MAATARSRALPRGPHGLSRDDVARSQRERILDAMTEAVAEKGYANTVVADVVTRSGVSRATFYALFSGKDDCFRAAYEAHAELVTAIMTTGLEQLRERPDIAPLEKLDRVLGLYLDALAGAPALARVFLVEVYAAGPALIRERRDVLEVFVDVVAATHDGEDGPLGTRPEQRFAAELLVAAVSSMVTNIVGVGDAERLPELRSKLMALAAQILVARP
jgi:AcrR family transcriptional regulator